MKKYILSTPLFLLILMIAGIVFAGVTLQYFTAQSNSEGMLVEWKTMEENKTAKFELERSPGSTDNFIYVATINATGNNSYYSYQDNSVDIQQGNSSSPIYYYRLKCVLGNGNYEYTQHISVIHAVSGIRSTWGSIKAIFR